MIVTSAVSLNRQYHQSQYLLPSSNTFDHCQAIDPTNLYDYLSLYKEQVFPDINEAFKKSIISKYYASQEFKNASSKISQKNKKNIKKETQKVVLFNKETINNMIGQESTFLPNTTTSYFESVQGEIKASMREILLKWMYEVLEECSCRREVFLVAVNYLDRFLSRVPIKKSQLQLLGCVCMLLSSKLKEANPLQAHTICSYTDNFVNPNQLLEWELLTVQVLNWDLSTITSQCYIDHFLLRIPIKFLTKRSIQEIKTYAQDFITFTALNIDFISHPPSLLCLACILASYHYLNIEDKSVMEEISSLIKYFHEIIPLINKEKLELLVTKIEESYNNYIMK